jgi:hypothetical protein
VILSATLSGFLSGFSPFWGLLIIIAYGFRHYRKNSIACLGSFAFAALISVWIIKPDNASLAVLDVILGVGLSAYIFFFYLKSSNDHRAAFLYSSGNGIIYGFLRQLLFRQHLNAQIIESSEQSLKLLNEIFSSSPEMLTVVEQSARQSVSLFQNYAAALWFLVIFSAIYLGSLWLSRRDKIIWQQANFSLPYWSVYLLIAALLFFLMPITKIAGANLLIIILPYFMVQGIAVCLYFWNIFTPDRKFLIYFVIVSLLLNYVFLFFLIFLGIADLWLMFRQKHQDKTKSL